MTIVFKFRRAMFRASLATALLTVCSWQLRAQDRQVFSGPDALQKVKAAIQRETHMPVRLPLFVLDNSPYLILQNTREDRYELVFAATRDCAGEHNCAFGILNGTKGELDEVSIPPQHVNLRNGVRADYYPPSIGSYCSNAELRWHEGSYTYSIAVKCGSLRELSNLAVSAMRKQTK